MKNPFRGFFIWSYTLTGIMINSGMSGMLKSVFNSKRSALGRLYPVYLQEVAHKLYIRSNLDDAFVLNEVFKQKEYSFSIKNKPDAILDAGGNIGLTAIFFANIFPKCTIITVEPDASNFELLLINTRPYSKIKAKHAAIWHRDGELEIYGSSASTFRVSEDPLETTTKRTIKALSIAALLDTFHLKKFDIIKLDIEGAERELFSFTSNWEKLTDIVIVELHERFKLGCIKACFEALEEFEEVFCSEDQLIFWYVRKDLSESKEYMKGLSINKR